MYGPIKSKSLKTHECWGHLRLSLCGIIFNRSPYKFLLIAELIFASTSVLNVPTFLHIYSFRYILEKLTVPRLVKRVPAFIEPESYHIHKKPTIIPILNETNQVHSTPAYFLRRIVILSSHL